MNSVIAYRIQNGKITDPVKGASLIGNGLDVLNKIDMIATGLKLGSGTCGKDGQQVPAGLGQPPLKCKKLQIVGSQI